MNCPNGCDAGWLRGWRPCQCAATEGAGGHDRWDCRGCNYTAVPGCERPEQKQDVYRYTREQ